MWSTSCVPYESNCIKEQRGLRFDDDSFMTSIRFYGKSTTAPSVDRRIEYALATTQAKEDASRVSGTLRELCRLGLNGE